MKCATSSKYCQIVGFGALLSICVVLTGLLGVAVARTKQAERMVAEFGAKEEVLKETFFYEGYDKGYQSAVVDAYLGKPLYMIEEGDGENSTGALWKKMDLDEANLQKLEGEKNHEE